MTTEQNYSSSMSVEQVTKIVIDKVKGAIDEGSTRPVQQIAEPEGWLNIGALGPFQMIGVTAPPLLPHKVIKDR